MIPAMVGLGQQFSNHVHSGETEEALKTMRLLRANAKELEYPPPLRGLVDDVAEACEERLKPGGFNADEMMYIADLATNLTDNEVEFISILNQIMQNLDKLIITSHECRLLTPPYYLSKLEEILFPKNFTDILAERKKLPAEARGPWSIWADISELAQKNDKFLDDLVKIRPAGFSALAMGYIEEFAAATLFSNVFHMGLDNYLLDDITSVFKLFALTTVREGECKPQQLPSLLGEMIDGYFSAPRWEHIGWPGTKQMAFMEVSNRLYKERFMGVKWKRYDPEKEFAGRIEFIVKGKNYYESEENEDRARNLYLQARDNLSGRMAHSADLIMCNAVKKFTTEFLEKCVINGKLGDLILRFANIFGVEDSNLDCYLTQPYTMSAINAAIANGKKFTHKLLEMVKNYYRMSDLCQYNDKRLLPELISRGQFILRANECNMSFKELYEMNKRLDQIKGAVMGEAREGHGFWILGNDYAIIYSADSFGRIYKAPEVFFCDGTLESLACRFGNYRRGEITPSLLSCTGMEFVILPQDETEREERVLIKPLNVDIEQRMLGRIPSEAGVPAQEKRHFTARYSNTHFELLRPDYV